MLNLPRPCRYEHLTLLASQGGVRSISIFVDVQCDQVIEALEHWRSLLPTTHLGLIAAEVNLEQVKLFVKTDDNASIVSLVADNFVDASKVKKINSPIWASCAAYDPSGVYVKTGLEKSLIPALSKNGGVFLVHDPSHKTVRQFDSHGLIDRVYRRSWRKLIYKIIWKSALALTWLATHLPVKAETQIQRPTKTEMPTHDAPLINQLCPEIDKVVLKLVLLLASQREDAKKFDDRKAASPAFSVIEMDDWKEALGLWRASGLPLLADLPKRNCPACNSCESHIVLQSYDGYLFSECEHCGTWYVPLKVEWAVFEKFFAICPPARLVAKKATTDRLEHSDSPDLSRFQRYFESVLDYMDSRKPQLQYLDIGCSVGHSLTAAKVAGMLPHGVEVDPDALALAKLNNDHVVADIGDLPAGKYDVISMWETLEHLADPVSMLQSAVDRLASHGLVAVTVPNLDASGLRVAREKCSYVYGGFNSPGHINFFNHRTIELLFNRVGLTLIEVSYEFSTNAHELFGYLGGAFATDRPYAMATPSDPLATILNAIWPSVTMIEEYAGTLPIMSCIACRHEDLERFSTKRGYRSEIRRKQLIGAAARHLEAHG